MTVTLRPDIHVGLTADQMAAMHDRLSERERSLREAAGHAGAGGAQMLRDADAIARDLPMWRDAADSLAGTGGTWSIAWDAMAEAASGVDAVIREYGARNSRRDLGSIQRAHDALVDLGATCSASEKAKAPTAAPADQPYAEAAMEATGDPATITFRESGVIDGTMTLREAGAEFDDEARELWITPIRPGPGNKRDGFYYPRETLREAVEAHRFDGVMMFANHPRKSDEKELPERSVRDWVGVIKETVWDASRDAPRARLKVLDADVYQRFKEAPEHIAFSVLGQGVARDGRVDGEPKRIVESVARVKSVDWVTQAGAGGGIDLRESGEEIEMDLQSMTADQFREAIRARPDLMAALREDEPVPDPEPDPLPDPEPEPGPGPEEYVTREEFEALRDALTVRESARDTAASRDEAGAIVSDALRTSVLTTAGREYLAEVFREATVGDGMLYADERGLRDAVDREVAALAKALGRRTSAVRGLGADPEGTSPSSLREAKETDLMARLGMGESLPSASAPGSVQQRVADGMASRGI